MTITVESAPRRTGTPAPERTAEPARTEAEKPKMPREVVYTSHSVLSGRNVTLLSPEGASAAVKPRLASTTFHVENYSSQPVKFYANVYNGASGSWHFEPPVPAATTQGGRLVPGVGSGTIHSDKPDLKFKVFLMDGGGGLISPRNGRVAFQTRDGQALKWPDRAIVVGKPEDGTKDVVSR